VAVLLVVVVSALVADWRTTFWLEHPFAASLAANATTLTFAILVIEWVVQARHRRRWRGLAVAAYSDLHNAVRGAWFLPLAQRRQLGGTLAEAKDRARWIHTSLPGADGQFRQAYARALEPIVGELRQAIGNWAAVLVDDDEYASDIAAAAALHGHLVSLQQLLTMGEIRSGLWAISPQEFVNGVRDDTAEALRLEERFVAMGRRLRGDQ
jgi:hypothetical protein